LARPAIEFAKDYFRGVINIIAEVGVRGGGHAFSMYEALKPSEIYLIDVYKTIDDDGPDSQWTPEQHIAWYRDAHKYVWNIPNCHFVLKRSQVAALYVPDNLDLVYIDASHTEFEVTKDIACWYPKVKPGGILCGHDYSATDQNQSVRKAVDRFFNNVATNDADWWIIKKCHRGYKS
jgi:hypothetical protein